MNIDFNQGMPRLSATLDPAGDGTVTIERLCERIAAAQGDLSEAEGKGLFAPLPKNESERSKDPSRIKTIRNRLFILGYLENDTGRGTPDVSLKEAIRAFQAEAGLDIDGWVGEQQTWPALQELVSFETPIDLSKWFRNDRALPALRRAVALRLFVLGLLPNRPRSPDEDHASGLCAFGHIWQLLFGETPRTEPSLTPEWLKLLFDMDGITHRLSTVSGTLSRETLNISHGFIINAAKIELWLMGYPVHPGGYDLVEQRQPPGSKGSNELTGMDIWMRSSTASQYHKIKRNFKFYKALHRFWIDNGYDDKTADSMSVGFLKNFQAFFGMVDQDLQEDAIMGEEQRQIELEKFVLERKDQLPTVYLTVKGLGARIWDGARRVWGWFRRMITKVRQKILTIGTNMSRIIYGFALGSFTVVSNVFGAMGSMIRWVTNPMLPGSDSKNIVFYRDFDNDVYVAVDKNAESGKLAACCEKLEHTARVFVFGCRVIGTFVSILADVFKTGWTAYFGLVLALIRIRRITDKIRELAEAYQEVFPNAFG